jgi:hypothetical protein
LRAEREYTQGDAWILRFFHFSCQEKTAARNYHYMGAQRQPTETDYAVAVEGIGRREGVARN